MHLPFDIYIEKLEKNIYVSIIINKIKSMFLPQVAGVSSMLGESLAKEFAEAGCSVICVDNDIRSVEEIITRLKSRYCRIEEIGSGHRKCETPNAGPTVLGYECNLLNRDAIREVAKKVEDEVGGIDILVTCVGLPNQDIFDTASTTLMSHYWVNIDQ